MNNTFLRLAPSLALCLPLLALAQAGRPDPADPKASAPALRYQSAFADYKPWADTKPGDWRAVNDTVRDAAAKGAHAGHGAGAAASAAPAPNASAPAMSAHGSHQHHGGKR
jgi:hypothetical protein